MIQATIMMIIVGGALGVLLGIAGKFFYVEPDSRVEDVTALLPGYNCGGCGFPGCSGFADAIVNEGAEPTHCKPCKPEQRAKIEEYMKAHA